MVVNYSKHIFRFQDLIKDLHSELSGDFRKLVMAMLKAPAEFDASELNSAIKVNAQNHISLALTNSLIFKRLI